MAVSKLLTVSALAFFCTGFSAALASGQSYVRYVDPIPAPEDFDNTVRAQFIKPGDVSPEEYARLLAEAEKIRSYQYSGSIDTSSQASEVPTYTYDGRPVAQTYSTQTYSSGTAAPNTSGYQIQMYDTPQPSVVTPVTATVTPERMTLSTGQHAVIKGDTMYSLSRRYNISLSDLKSYNGMTSNDLKIGQVLNVPTRRVEVTESLQTGAQTTLVRNVEPVPANGVYAVLPGDTLYSISRRACVNLDAIKAANAMGSATTIHPGQRLSLPTGHCLR